MKQIHMCASILLSVKWNIGRISKVLLEIRKARSTTHNPILVYYTLSVNVCVCNISFYSIPFTILGHWGDILRVGNFSYLRAKKNARNLGDFY